MQQIQAEGVKRAVLITDQPEKYDNYPGGVRGIEIVHRDYLDKIQRELRETEGVTAIVYDQTCAAEKRRRRKRGTYPDPPKRAFIVPDVCEGLSDPPVTEIAHCSFYYMYYSTSL